MKEDAPKLTLIFRICRLGLEYKAQVALALSAMVAYSLARCAVALVIKQVFDHGLATNAAPASASTPPLPGAAAALGAGHSVSGALSSYGPDTVILLVGLAVMAIAAVLFVSEYLSFRSSGFVTQKVMIVLRCRLCDKLLRMPIAFFNDRKNGDLIARLTNDIEVTNQATKLLFGDFIKESFVLLSCLGTMLYISWPLTLVTFVAAPVLGILMRKFGKRVLRASRDSLENFSDLANEMTQIFSGIRTVKVFNMEKREMDEFQGISERLLKSKMKMISARASSRAFTSGIGHLGLGLAACGGFFLLRRTTMSAGDLYAFLTLVATIYRPLKGIGEAYNNVNEALAATHRVFELLDAEPGMEDHPGSVTLPDEHTNVRLRGVSFAYNGDDVLRNIDLDVPAGQLVAIVGPSGSGKSTLLDLIPRFYDPQEGTVEVDGLDLRRVSRASLLQRISVVTQRTFLFNTTIAENIRYGRPGATDEEVSQAAKLSRIHDFIQALPEGYQTNVGEQGVKLSGGQRQRISLARAFLKNAPILILDEATSELDTETEKQVQESLRRVSSGRTIFVVAHRLSTIIGADRIIVLDGGRIVESGTHEELMARNGYYRRLYELQFSGAEMGGNGAPGDLARKPATLAQEVQR